MSRKLRDLSGTARCLDCNARAEYPGGVLGRPLVIWHEPDCPNRTHEETRVKDKTTAPTPTEHLPPPYYGERLRSMRFDDELWDAAKAEAAHRGETVNGAVRDFLRGYVKGKGRSRKS